MWGLADPSWGAIPRFGVPRLLSFLLFFAIALGILGLAHYYLWLRLVRDLGLPSVWQRTLTGLWVLLYLSIPGSLILSRTHGASTERGLIYIGLVWLGMLLLLLVVVGAIDLLRGGVTLASSLMRDAPGDPSRRTFLSRSLAALATLVAGGLGLQALRSGLGAVVPREIRVELRRLPSELSGLSIVQLTDMHVGPTLGRDFVQKVVDEANRLDPDVVAITGDLVDGSVEELREAVAPLAFLRARYGVFFVTGNHEYYSGAEEWCTELRRLGIRVLRNERVSIGPGDISFDLAGVDDHHGGSYLPSHGPDLERAVRGRDPKRELVLLAHQPRALYQATEHGVGLQLSGHTHGGQIWPWSLLVRLQQPVVSGLARFGETLVYVSNGTGYWGPPMRLGAPAEITRVILEAPREALA